MKTCSLLFVVVNTFTIFVVFLYINGFLGGGGTFGVVLESTILASPQITLQVVLVSLKERNPSLTKSLWSLLVDNGLTWANEGWGGLSNAQVAAYVNPKLSKADAEKSMAPLISFGKQLGNEASVVVREFPSWGSFFETFAQTYVAVSAFPCSFGDF